MSQAVVSVCMVTHNSASDLAPCLESVSAQESIPWELVIVDCASTDRTLDEAGRALAALGRGRLIDLEGNLGFTGGMNIAVAESSAPYVLCLNADTRLRPDFLQALVSRARRHPDRKVGAVTGRLLRPDGEGLLDAAGMRLRPTWRHLDRGSGQADRGQFAVAERVFGGTGAATLFSRDALEDTSIDGEVFLAEFHSYREDAELCFRLCERDWAVLYEPEAVAIHVRRNLPERRRRMPAFVNYHSLKNRFLLRAYHETWATLLLTALPTLIRDLGILGYLFLRERTSFPALGWLWNRRRRILTRRRRIQARRSVPSLRVAAWFWQSSRPL